jgi:hypothetical protein
MPELTKPKFQSAVVAVNPSPVVSGAPKFQTGVTRGEKPDGCECCGRIYAGVAGAGLSWSNRRGKWACVRCHFADARGAC